MKWTTPPIIKVYEALGAIGDERIEFLGPTGAKGWSSRGNKYYNVVYDADKHAIMANDNGSYYQGYLGYPAIAFLLLNGNLSFRQEYADALKGIEWKDINTHFNNDFEQTQKHVDGLLQQQGVDLNAFHTYLANILEEISALNLELLGPKVNPPNESKSI